MQPFHPATPQHHRTYPQAPATPDSPSIEKESHIGTSPDARQAREAADGVLRDYEEKRDRLAKAIDSSVYLLSDLKNFNGEQWTVRYPHLRPTESNASGSSSSRPGMSRRTLTFADEPSQPTDVVLSSTPSVRRTLKRSLTIAPPAPTVPITTAPQTFSEPKTVNDNEDDFSILRLDLNMGPAKHAKALISHLEKSSISSLLDNRITASLDHLTLLQKRIFDAQSRVLVTGDLNAGKSTLINALLRRDEVMPTDQQPLTTRFVEVVSAKENDDKEEIHILDQADKYNPADKSTYSIEDVAKLEELVTDAETDASSPPLRVFLKEADANLANPSILHNGVVDISLIDAPGLNRDSIKTTANFARQEEIDVVVFVVSAANHFTLSAKEFIWQAGHEKAHLFIVVNRFDQIRDKARCRRLVLEQIKQLSPKTYEDAADLVHFVDSAKVALGYGDDADAEADDLDAAFSHLEHSLRSFVLVNRAKSKLGPAQNYVTHLLADVELLAAANSLVAGKERDAAREELARVKPVLEKMKKGKEGLEESLIGEEESVSENASSRTKKAMERGLERVARGEMAAPAPGLSMPSYPGLLGVWDYAAEVKRVLLSSLDFAVGLAEDDARKLTSEGVEEVSKLGDAHLPADVERSNRKFNPQAMFTPRATTTKASRRQSSSVATLGLGLATQAHLAEVNVTDIFDLQHHIFIARAALPHSSSSSSSSPSHELVPFQTELSGVGAASLAVGAFSMLSGKTLGLRAVVEGIVHFSDFVSNPATRRWVGPIVGVCTVGAIAYVIYDLPRSIPRNVGRHLQATLSVSSGSQGDDASVSFSDAQAARVGKEVRKVMRLAAWDLRERFRAAVEARGEAVKASEQMERRAVKALKWFEEVEKKVETIREEVGVKV
ncbi:mitofusin [Kwoniella heveanensis BCC8398]|uniref:Mitofusin n=1 Tax=Kwoniella heveanensis BCC8398 TaxID=1296120 RepID=A0A1B9GJU8_9TREE|nr:mitofusin [Kwoniella heveanensis BCC8398]